MKHASLVPEMPEPAKLPAAMRACALVRSRARAIPAGRYIHPGVLRALPLCRQLIVGDVTTAKAAHRTLVDVSVHFLRRHGLAESDLIRVIDALLEFLEAHGWEHTTGKWEPSAVTSLLHDLQREARAGA